jgi:hypothetical protein
VGIPTFIGGRHLFRVLRDIVVPDDRVRLDRDGSLVAGPEGGSTEEDQ